MLIFIVFRLLFFFSFLFFSFYASFYLLSMLKLVLVGKRVHRWLISPQRIISRSDVIFYIPNCIDGILKKGRSSAFASASASFSECACSTRTATPAPTIRTTTSAPTAASLPPLHLYHHLRVLIIHILRKMIAVVCWGTISRPCVGFRSPRSSNQRRWNRKDLTTTNTTMLTSASTRVHLSSINSKRSYGTTLGSATAFSAPFSCMNILYSFFVCPFQVFCVFHLYYILFYSFNLPLFIYPPKIK